MASYPVKLADGPDEALNDLAQLPQDVRKELFDVMRTELRVDPEINDDNGRLDDKWLLRRGITRARAQGQALSTSQQLASNFMIAYRPFTEMERQEHNGQAGFYVWRVWPNDMIAGRMKSAAPST
ncbi:hypothetical protein [Krasilnikovia sp. M28-CT-15]|uniref:hypothetical protein n=1 Tax=Krasilnikovia sp. M28-CT-15 TaxID=3373540 RepID=UPI003876138A